MDCVRLKNYQHDIGTNIYNICTYKYKNRHISYFNAKVHSHLKGKKIYIFIEINIFLG